MQSHLSQERRYAPPAFRGQQGPDRRRQIAHRGIQANAPGRTALQSRFSAIRPISSIYERRREWDIEQLFRTLKRQGLGIEQSVIEDGAALEKLAVIALIGATITMQLVLARAAADRRPQAGDDQTAAAKPPARRVFNDTQINVLDVLQKRLQGRTLKQQNPHSRGTLAWAGWTIARLGGWTGYTSDKSAGPITMRDGLQRFNAIVERYQLARNVCPS